MSQLIFIDSFGHYNIGQMASKWTAAGGSIVTSLPTGSGSGFRGSCAKTIGNYLQLTAGVRAFFGTSKNICTFQNTVIPLGISFSVISDGRIRAAVKGVLFAYSTFAITFGANYHFQVNCTFTPTLISTNVYTGTYNFNVYVNGVLRLSGSLVDANENFNGLLVAQLNFAEVDMTTDDGSGGWAGDFWLTDGELLGDCQIVPLFPRANGTTNQWTPLSGTNFSEVNDHIVNDTKYNSDATAGHIDEYFMDLIGSFSGTIKGAQLVLRVANDAPDNSTCQGVYRNGAGTVVLAPSGVFAPSLNSYAFFLDTNRLSVFTGIDWTQAEIDASQSGIKRVS